MSFLELNLELEGHQVLFHMKFRSTKVDQQSSFDSRRLEIAKQLRNVLVRRRLTGFEFDNQAIFDKDISENDTQRRPRFRWA